MNSSETTATPVDLPSFSQLVGQRRATTSFLPDPVPDEDLAQILACARQAPSGYNLQPWRFVVVRDPANRRRLQAAALGQDKVAEAPVVIAAFGRRSHWEEHATKIFQEAADRGALNAENLPSQQQAAIAFVAKLPTDVWLNRHVMIAFTYLMLAAEALGWDTAPMEGFDAAAVARVLELPDDAEVVALLAIGRHREPDRKHPGRLPLDHTVFVEKFGRTWSGPGGDDDSHDH